MRILVFLTVLLILFSGCRVKKSSKKSVKLLPKQESRVVAQKETVENEAPIVVRDEVVSVIDKQEKLPIGESYFVIMGSFKVLENAKRFQAELSKKRFTSQLLQNEEGLYRVSVFNYNDIEDARSKVFSIRKDYPEHHDVWLLRKKN